jgi:hypothetical protein
MICHLDLMATVAAILGTKLPADAGVDSINILPLLLGEATSQPLREAIVHHTGSGKFAIRKGPWVLIFAPTGDDIGRKSGGVEQPIRNTARKGEGVDGVIGQVCDGGAQHERADAKE